MRNVLDTRKDWKQERGAIEQEVAQDLSSPLYLWARGRARDVRRDELRALRPGHEVLGSTRPRRRC